MDHDKELTTDPKDNNTTNNYSCRRLRLRMGSKFTRYKSHWTMDTARKNSINKRSGTESNPLCPPPTCETIQKFQNKDIYRQHDSSKIQRQIRRHCLTRTSRFSYLSTGSLQSIQFRRRISTYSRKRKYSSRSTKPPPAHNQYKTNTRSIDADKAFQTTKSTMGATDDRCICDKNKPKTTNILEHLSGPGCDSDRCFSTTLAEEGTISIPPVEIDTSNTSTNKTTKNTTSSSDNTILADTILVPNIITDETQITTNQLQDQPMDDDRMAIIRNKRKKTDSIDEQTLDFLTQSHRKATHRIYNNNWKKMGSMV